ncbi:MAG: hypothetical protein JXR33_05635 [Coriobacteriia bacterium]|nr:hypothetical protein [Coriobacteriia bacterium]
MDARSTTVDLSGLWRQIPTLLNDPASNPPAAFLLYGIIAVILLLVVVVALMFLGSRTDEDEPASKAAEVDEPDSRMMPVRPTAAKRIPLTAQGRVAVAGISVAVLLVVWTIAGASTSGAAVCDGCHVSTPHTTVQTGRPDPHEGEVCVSCHEPGGRLGRYFLDVPSRMLHFLDGAMQAGLNADYGRVAQSACISCHGPALEGVGLSEDRGIRMSHAEPLEASAPCLGCHTPEEGVVGSHNAGMAPCLRCHDSQIASAECAECHESSTTAAARARSAVVATRQIRELTCGGCHDEEKECDTCHGLRLPHSRAFVTSAHARAGAVDFWFNDGKACGRCHTAQRNPCQKCHTPFLGTGHPIALAQEHTVAKEAACDSCHQQWEFRRDRDFCEDVCHTAEAIEMSPR